jgi:hypothetical protein
MEINSFLLGIAILSSCLEHPDFNVRSTARKNLTQINNIVDVSSLIQELSLESKWAKQQIVEDSFTNWFNSLYVQSLLHFRPNDQIMPEWGEAMSIFNEIFYGDYHRDYDFAVKVSVKHYIRLLAESSYSRSQIEQMVRRQY